MTVASEEPDSKSYRERKVNLTGKVVPCGTRWEDTETRRGGDGVEDTEMGRGGDTERGRKDDLQKPTDLDFLGFTPRLPVSPSPCLLRLGLIDTEKAR